MSLNLEQLQRVWNLHRKLDDLLESLLFRHSSIETTLNQVYIFLKEEIAAKGFFTKTKNEKLIESDFCYGICKDIPPQLPSIKEFTTFSLNESCWFAQPIDLDNKIIGIIAISFGSLDSSQKEYYSEVLNTVSELLDSYLYSIHCSCIKQEMIMGLQEALTDLDISSSLNKAVKILYQSVKFKNMIVVYIDKEIMSNDSKFNYLYYEKCKLKYDNLHPMPLLEKAIAQKNILSISAKKFSKILNLKNITMSYLAKGVDKNDTVGLMAVETYGEEPLSLLAQELLQIFSEELRQRLIDLNREKNILRKFFPSNVVYKLITTPNYEKRYLQARNEKIGIILADLTGFTKLSEQILKSPNRITDFVNKWAKGILCRVFPLEACLDKLVGDCLMFLFGPPFYNRTPECIVENMIKASVEIVDYTKSYLNQPNNADIQKHQDFNEFGVKVGVNFCNCTVGLIGPNEDLTAFSSGVNITARLQGIAETNEILVTEEVKNIISTKENNWRFSEKQSTMVKNIEKPLGYYKLLHE